MAALKHDPRQMDKKIRKEILDELFKPTDSWIKEVTSIIIAHQTKDPFELSEAINDMLTVILLQIGQEHALELCVCVAYKVMNAESKIVKDKYEAIDCAKELLGTKRPDYVG